MTGPEHRHLPRPDREVCELRKSFGAHTFPHKRIRWRVTTARKPYACDTEFRAPPGHTPRIERGEAYLTVSMLPPRRPDSPSRDHWEHARLCAACGAHFGLAEVKT